MEMYNLLAQLSAVALAGVLDRIRGDSFDIGHGIIDKLLLGFAMAVVAGFITNPVVATLIAGAMVLGMSFGWGAPVGAALSNSQMNSNALEWWQFGPLKTNADMALIFRGFMWGLPVALVGVGVHYFDTSINIIPLLAFIPAYMVAMYIPVKLTKNWETYEYMRGFIAALLVFGSTFIA